MRCRSLNISTLVLFLENRLVRFWKQREMAMNDDDTARFAWCSDDKAFVFQPVQAAQHGALTQVAIRCNFAQAGSKLVFLKIMHDVLIHALANGVTL